MICYKCRQATTEGPRGGVYPSPGIKLCPLHEAAPALLRELKESMQWVAKLAADRDQEGYVDEIGERAANQVRRMETLIKEIEG